MTLGEKIRKYRLLKGWTQKELGIAVGFSAVTADSRIRKYESDLMTPRDEMRLKLANALDVDLSSISDTDIATYEDVMQALFLFEESYEMDIDTKDGKTLLVFDNSNISIRTLITFMNIWRNQKATLLSDPINPTPDQLRAYQIWKSRFSSNISEYFSNKEKAIEAQYNKLITKAEKSCPYAKKTSDITLLLRKIVESGFTISTLYNYTNSPTDGPGFTFIVSELLDPPSEDAAHLFAQFLSEIKHFSKLGAKVYTELQLPEDSLLITYFIPVASFSIIKDQLDDLLEYRRSVANGNKNEFSRDSFETSFANSLKTDYCYIEDEIARYSDR